MEFDRFFFEKQYAIYEGEYTVNIFGEIEPNGFGIYKDPIGRNYEGGWKDGIFYGQGKYTYLNYVMFVGEYKDGIKTGKQIYDSGVYTGVWDYTKNLKKT